jgi:hypothetical protein
LLFNGKYLLICYSNEMSSVNQERQTGNEAGVENSYNRVFSEIERTSKGDGGLTSQGAYELYEAHLAANNLDPTVYLSMAITSGGFVRDDDLTVGEVIEKNSAFGIMARKALLRQHPEFSERDIVLPSDLGKVKGWSQSDYLLFWFHTITGLTVEHARGVSEAMLSSLSYPGFTDKTLNTDDRWQDYQRFTDDYVRCLSKLRDEYGRNLQPNNVQAMVMILDGNMSLGGRAEERLCRALGIPPQFQFLDVDTLKEAPDFRDSVVSLREMGAQALGTSLNPPGIQFCGVSEGVSDVNLAFSLGFRKTGLSNAAFAADHYRKHQATRPPRHGGHTPIGPAKAVTTPTSNEALWRSYYSE